MMKLLEMMKVGLPLFFGSALSAGTVDWNEWTLYCHDGLTPECAAKLTVDSPVPRCGGKVLAGRRIQIPATGIDLNPILGGTPRVGRAALLVKKVSVPEDTRVKLGMGVDWWFEAFCNGRIVYSTWRGGGNHDYPPTAQDHVFALNLRKGENLVAICLFSGQAGFTAAVGEMPPEMPAGCASPRLAAELNYPPRHTLRHGPWLLEPSPGRITVAFLTDGLTAGGVEYRRKGDCEWRKKWHTAGGVLQRSGDLHRIALENLEPGAVYEYRVLIAPDDTQYKTLETHEFTAPAQDGRSFCFFATADTQFGAARRGRYLAGWKNLLADTAFLVSLGDQAGVFDDMDLELFGGWFNYLSEADYHGKPFVAVRGNHEQRGAERGRWFGLLGPSSGEGYYAFQYGKTFFVVLDTGGDATDLRRNPLTGEATREYMTKQRQWVEHVAASPEYAAAEYRIILAHEAPYSHQSSAICDMAKFLTEPLVEASRRPERRIHLYLTGHIHRYRRSVPDSTVIYANAAVPAEDCADGGKYNFPIVTMDGPGKHIGFEVSATTVRVTPECLEVRSFDENSRCFDHFTVDKQGRITEKDNPYKKQILQRYESNRKGE